MLSPCLRILTLRHSPPFLNRSSSFRRKIWLHRGEWPGKDLYTNVGKTWDEKKSNQTKWLWEKMSEALKQLDLDDNATKRPDRSKRILDPHDCLGLVAVLWFLAVLGLDTTINHWGLADEHLADEEMMLMAIFLKFLNSLTLLSVLSVSLISRVEKGIPSSFLPTLMVILSERGTTWVFYLDLSLVLIIS